MAHRDRAVAVLGEALMDLLPGRDGSVVARPGGGPFNTARTLARLGQQVTYLGRLADDGFGRVLREHLLADGVLLGVSSPASAPTALAVADVDSAGNARYQFYLSGTSAGDVSHALLAGGLPRGLCAVHAGTLRPSLASLADAVSRVLLEDLAPSVLVMVDPNCRPGTDSSPSEYRSLLFRVLPRADVVKASVEDLAYLFPDLGWEAAARSLLGQGPALVLVTDGPRPAVALSGSFSVRADVPSVRVVDTIGAGDAFGGAFLACCLADGLRRADLALPGKVGPALRTAVEAAALTCTRPGAEPPTLAELSAAL